MAASRSGASVAASLQHQTLSRCHPSQAEQTGRVEGWQRACQRLLRGSDTYASRSQQRLAEAGVSRSARKHPLTGRWEVAPVIDGRIALVGGSAHGGSAHGGSSQGSGA